MSNISFRSKFFGSIVDIYEEGRIGPSSEVYHSLHEYIKPDEAILDLGCGTGKSTGPLFDQFDRVYGCDHDEKMLNRAQGKFPKFRSNFSIGSAKKGGLPYPDKMFGLITMCSSFHWYCNADAVDEIAGKLKERGFVYVVEGNKALLSERTKEIMSRILGCRMIGPKEGYDPIVVLKQGGFSLLKESEIFADECYSIEQAVKNCQSCSYWDHIREESTLKAEREHRDLLEVRDEMERTIVDQLREMFQSVANSDGFIDRKASRNCLLFQKNI